MERFLQRLWGSRRGFVFLPRKRGRWKEVSTEWPSNDVGSLIDQSSDSYFSPHVYRENKRSKESSLPCRFLYADLDTVDPRSISLRPTIAVKTSPGRYQAYWEIDRALGVKQFEALNQRLTYATGADKGGWFVGKVLRIPDTFNYKYSKRMKVRLMWDDGPVYTRTQIRKFVSGVETHHLSQDISGLVLPPETADSILSRIKDSLDARTRNLISGDIEPGEEGRSGLLWELECRLLEYGLDPEEVFVVVRESPWNKFSDRGGGDSVLWGEVRKAHLHVGSSREGLSPDEGTSFVRMRPRVVSYSDLLSSSIREPEWLIEEWWTLGSHGVIAGMPKSYKSMVAIDLVFSVVSETPFLGLYDINPHGVGPALVVQQENSQALMRDRLVKIGHNRGLFTGKAYTDGDNLVVTFPPSLPILFYNDFSFDMNVVSDREAVEEIIQKEGIKMVVFDPLYLMIGDADENNGKDMRPILTWLLRIRNLYQCSVVVVHHWGKGRSGRGSKGGRGLGGTRLLGHTTLYGWLEAALYLEATRHIQGQEIITQVVVEREFRERVAPPPVAFELKMDDIGGPNYSWERTGTIGTGNRVLWFIREAGDSGTTLKEIREGLEIGEKRLRSEMADLLNNNEVRVETEGRLKRFYAEEG